MSRQSAATILDLLTVHPSFWTGDIVSYSSPSLGNNTRRTHTEKSFLRWQALKRNEEYDKWAYDTYIDNADFFFGKPFFGKYFENYPPKPSQNFTQWRARVIDKTRRFKKADEIEWEIAAKKVVWRKLPEGLPSRWLPIPAWIEFPHPDALRLLTPMQVGLCVSPVSFNGTAQINVRNRRLWIDLSCSLHQIIREILSYDDLLGIKSNKDKTDVTREAKIQLRAALRHRPRSTTPTRKRTRKRTQEPPRLARIFTAWDLKRDGASFAQIAKTLWPKEYSDAQARGRLRKEGNRQAVLQKAKDHVKDAERLIKRAFCT